MHVPWSYDGYWTHVPFSFTSPFMRHLVPSHTNRAVTCIDEGRQECKTAEEYM
jgi:hypothetical protein